MDKELICEELGRAIEAAEGDYHDRVFGEYHPSALSGCPLGEFLDWMLDKEIPLNNHMFNGKCVHYWLQETGVLQEALHNAGFHAMDTAFEVGARYEIEPGVNLVGRADVVCNNGDSQMVIDIKYSSLKAHYNSGRLYKYATQVNTYAGMLGADRWGLLLIHSKADNIPESITMLTNEFNEDSWEGVQKRALQVHEALDHAGWPSGNRFDKQELMNVGQGYWEEIMEHFDEEDVPFYDGELKYSDRDEWVMPYQDDWKEDTSTGLASFKS